MNEVTRFGQMAYPVIVILAALLAWILANLNTQPQQFELGISQYLTIEPTPMRATHQSSGPPVQEVL